WRGLGASVFSIPVSTYFFGSRDPEVFKLVPGPECRDKPSRLLATTGPRLGWGGRIKVFRQNFWVFAPRPVRQFVPGSACRLCSGLRATQLSEALFQLALFCADLLCEDLRQLFVQEPEFVEVHPF